MSSTYIIPKKGLSKEELESDEFEYSDAYFVIGKTSSFNEAGEILKDYLPDDTPIICIDNDTKVKTLGDLKKYYK